MKILTIVGARPQFVKAAVLSREILKRDGVSEVIVHTGQHFDSNMSEIFFKEMDIPKPQYQLDINSMGHGEMTGNMLIDIEKILLKENPDWVVVYGDTNSTLAGALAASKLHIPIAHVEAGLRSFNMKMPEEVNRILTDRVSNLLFCPSENAVEILEKEGLKESNFSKVHYVGDIMYDGVLHYRPNSKKPNINVESDFLLLTLHRAENTDSKERLEEIVKALNEIHENISPIVLPLHPRTKKKLLEYGLELKVNLIEPVGYHQMLWLIDNSRLVLTDSGGLQKEAYFCDKYCVTLRDETEWIELVDNNVNTLVGSSYEKIVSSVKEALKTEVSFPKNIYGDGKCAQKIIDEILNYS